MEMIKGVFLSARHWQIFVFLLAVPYVVEIVCFTRMAIVIAIMAVQITLWLLWYWSLGSFLNSLVRPKLRAQSGFFYFSLIYPLVYMPVFFWLAFKPGMEPGLAIIPPHLLGMFCMFNVLRFVSRSFAMAETGRKVKFGDYAGSFFLLWFFPIGVWILQPKVNQLFARKGIGEEPSSGS